MNLAIVFSSGSRKSNFNIIYSKAAMHTTTARLSWQNWWSFINKYWRYCYSKYFGCRNFFIFDQVAFFSFPSRLRKCCTFFQQREAFLVNFNATILMKCSGETSLKSITRSIESNHSLNSIGSNLPSNLVMSTLIPNYLV